MNVSRIHLLPDNVISQIAAAEVVQRPAAVVKELLENAIDAHSKEIKLIVREGGKQLIQVIDDGDGMTPEDAERCFERHATSKIASVEDLFNIQTLGFRGEALASIAAVAQVELITKTAEDELGTKIIIEGGKLKSKTAVATKKGTQITVKNLFFNIPARRNFLKSTTAENRHIIEELQRAALTNPEVAFSYWQNDHHLYSLKASKPIHRIVQLFGENYQKHLIPCQEDAHTIQLQGYIAAPSQSKKTRGGQFLFVNNRYVKSPFIHHAIKKAFEGLILPDTFPFYVLKLAVPTESIDVHVHPMKTEVKFEDESLIYTIVSAAIKKALAVHHVIPSIDFDTNVNENPLTFSSNPPTRPPSGTPTTKEESDYAQFKNSFHDHKTSAIQTQIPETDEVNTSSQSLLKIGSDANYKIKEAPTEQKMLDNNREKRFLNLHNTYILTPLKSGMLVVNLKAAYERILYERYCTYLEKKPNAVQKLLFPAQVKVAPADFSLIQTCQSHIEKLGFRIEMKSPDTVTFTAQPPEAEGKDLQKLLEELIEQYKATYALDTKKEGEAWAKSFAKRIASYQKKKVLEQNEVHALVDQLFACKNANYTPEGKRTWHVVPTETFTRFLLDLDDTYC